MRGGDGSLVVTVCLQKGARAGFGLVWRFGLALAVAVGGAPAGADRSCDWHLANDDSLDFAHYDSVHDRDGDGVGCDQMFGAAPVTVSTVVFGEELAVGERIELSELEDGALLVGGSDAVDVADDDEGFSETAAATLLVNSNFRRGPGLAYYIVGGGAAGSEYEWTQAAYGSGGYIWYELALPAGAGWVRGDLVDVRGGVGR